MQTNVNTKMVSEFFQKMRELGFLDEEIEIVKSGPIEETNFRFLHAAIFSKISDIAKITALRFYVEACKATKG